MRFSLNKFLLLVISVFVSFPNISAQETGSLDLTEGFTEKKLGAKVEKISVQENTGIQKVTISVPKNQIAAPIEEIIVIEAAPEKPEREEEQTVPQAKPYEFIKDFDNDRYGLIIYLGKDLRLPLRLYFSTDQTEDL